MNVLEHQAKKILSTKGLAVPKGIMATTALDAKKAAKKLGGKKWAVKAQVLAGGRGKAGGVKIAASLEEVSTIAESMLGKRLVTKQTVPAGEIIGTIYIEELIEIKKEYYLAAVFDRAAEAPAMIVSTEGGTEIETIAADRPEKIVKVTIDPEAGLTKKQTAQLASALKIPSPQNKAFSRFAHALYDLYQEKDALLIEINPLTETVDGRFVALDAKIAFDDNALFRHDDIAALRTRDEQEPEEIEAAACGMIYIKLKGDIGCMVNGAGLAMATMDIIKHAGGAPANFLDVGGKANAESIAKGLELLLRNKEIKSIFINIFGGIVRCDRIADGILQAVSNNPSTIPLIVRLDGTNAKEAAKRLNKARIKNIIPATDFADGAKKAVAL